MGAWFPEFIQEDRRDFLDLFTAAVRDHFGAEQAWTRRLRTRKLQALLLELRSAQQVKCEEDAAKALENLKVFVHGVLGNICLYMDSCYNNDYGQSL